MSCIYQFDVVVVVVVANKQPQNEQLQKSEFGSQYRSLARVRSLSLFQHFLFLFHFYFVVVVVVVANHHFTTTRTQIIYFFSVCN